MIAFVINLDTTADLDVVSVSGFRVLVDNSEIVA
jgi:hypothetical protein